MSLGARLQAQLDDPRPDLVADLEALDGDIVVLGAAGKLGPSLVRLALNGIAKAGSSARVFAVSRFTDASVAENLREAGAEVVVADVADETALAALPDAANVIFLVGSKFGTSGQESATWATNTYLPGRVAERYAGSRIVALSTANVYPYTPVGDGGATESTAVAPVGEYAMSCLGRERVLEHVTRCTGSPLALVRLSYAVEMRYGVLVDIARAVHAGQEIDLSTGHANVVWQGYANEVIIRCLPRAAQPPLVLNLTGPELLSVRKTALAIAEALGATARFAGTPQPDALLTDASYCHGLFGYPQVPLATLVEATADWVAGGGALLDKPTKFQRRDGRF
jgi:nucleoside-diphosphate-sugar epimerase